MTDGIEVKADIPDFKRQLDAFGRDFELKTIRAATAAAGQVYKKAVIALVPVLVPRAGNDGPSNRQGKRIAGQLKRSIYLVRAKDSTTGRIHYVVSFRKGKAGQDSDTFYGRFLERGWIPRGKRAVGGRRARALRQRNEAHNKITKYAFIVPAFKNVGNAALDVFNRIITERIEKENRESSSGISGSLL